MRKALNIPANVNGSIVLRSSFASQAALAGLTEGSAIDIDDELTVTLPASSLFCFDGIDAAAAVAPVESIALATENNAVDEYEKSLIEIGFPAASQIEFDFLRRLIVFQKIMKENLKSN